MTRSHVLSTFRKAGFPLRYEGYRYRYTSSVVSVSYEYDDSTIRVWLRGMGKDFQSPSKAMKYIQRVLDIRCVVSNEWALRRPARGFSFQVLNGGAA